MDIVAAVEHSGAIAAFLAGDEVDGVAAHANGMVVALGLDEKEHVGHDMASGHDSSHAEIAAQLAILADESASMSDAREAFLTLQETFIPIAEMTYVGQDSESAWGVYYCGMAKGSWIQQSGEVANPFYGAKMLRCGNEVSALGEDAVEEAGEHGAHGAR